MASGKHSKGKHSVPKGSKRGAAKEFQFPRGPEDPEISGRVEVPEEIAKTAAGKMQTAESGHDEQPAGEAATAEVLDEWVEEQAPKKEKAAHGHGRKRKRGRVAIAVVAAAVVVIIAAVAFAAVANLRSAATPSQTVQTALEAVKDRDFEAFGKVYAGDGSSLESSLENAFAQGAGLGSESELESRLNDEQKKVLAELSDKVTDFDYTIDSEQTDGDSATVRVTVTTYDFGAFAQNVLGSYIADGLAAASKGDLESDADAATRFASVLEAHLGELGEKGRSTQTDFALVRGDDGSWKLSELSADNLDALSGGLLSTTAEMARQLQSGSAG